MNQKGPIKRPAVHKVLHMWVISAAPARPPTGANTTAPVNPAA